MVNNYKLWTTINLWTTIMMNTEEHQSTFWPNQDQLKRGSLIRGSQIQYFLKEEIQGDTTFANMYAVNILDAKTPPYRHTDTPPSLTSFLLILAAIQWSYSHLYLVKNWKTKLLHSYILCMEKILDLLWDAISKNDVGSWKENVATSWCNMQLSTGGFHLPAAIQSIICKD